MVKSENNWSDRRTKQPQSILLFHKSKGIVVTRQDERGRRTIYDSLPSWVMDEGYIPVGRLDRQSTGLLLLTTDGVLMDRLTRPGHCLKTYEVWVRGHVDASHIHTMIEGIHFQDDILRAVSVEPIGRAGPKTRLKIVLDEGKNRHIRRMVSSLIDPNSGRALKVTDLKRIAFGPISLDIPSGTWRFLSDDESRLLYRAVEAG